MQDGGGDQELGLDMLSGDVKPVVGGLSLNFRGETGHINVGGASISERHRTGPPKQRAASDVQDLSVGMLPYRKVGQMRRKQKKEAGRAASEEGGPAGEGGVLEFK